MEIILNNIAKRYLYDWVFRNLTIHFKTTNRYAILGANGSGKSTLLKVLSGHLSPSKGTIQYKINSQEISKDDIYKHISFASPYIDLIEEFTLLESIQFHQQFKPFFNNLNTNDFLDLIQLKKAKDKEIRFFSSGMKQRLKLGLAICSNTSLLLLDEPTATLDEKSVEWFHLLLEKYTSNRLIIIASNEARDVKSCQEIINILDYKKAGKVLH